MTAINWRKAALSPLQAVAVAAVVCGTMLAVFGLQNLGFFGVEWGVLPRTFDSWRGFIMAPFMHGSWGHLIGNLSALAILIPLCGTLYPKETLKSLPIIWVVSFATIWLLGAPNSSHIGASGIIYGLMSFAVFLAIFHRSWGAVLGCLVVAFFFAGALWGLMPKQGVSFTAHLGGAVGGFVAAYVLRKKWKQD